MSSINPNDDEILKAAMNDLDDDSEINHYDKDILNTYLIDKKDECEHITTDNNQPKQLKGKKWIGAFVAILVIIFGISIFIILENYHDNAAPIRNTDSQSISVDEQIDREIAVMQAVDKGFSEIESNYLVDGFVPISQLETVMSKEYEYANSLVERGIAKTAAMEDLCVYVEFESEDICMYSPQIEGLLNTGENNTIITLEPFYGELTNGEPDSVAKKIERKNSNYKFTDNLDKKEVTLTNIQQMKNASIIIWSGHGDYTEKTHSVLMTCESAYSAKRWLDSGNRKKGDKIIDNNGTLAICPSFIDNHFEKNDFKDTVIFLGTCCSAKDDYLLNILKSKGASAVYGTTNYISNDYCDEMMNSLFNYISNGYSVKTALKKAQNECGAHDNRWNAFASDLSGKKMFSAFLSPARIVLIGNDESFKLEQIHETTASAKVLDDVPAVDRAENIDQHDSFVGKLCATEWVIVREGDFIYFKFSNDGKVKMTRYVPEKETITAEYDVIDDETVYFGYKNGISVTRLTISNRSERDMVDVEIVEYGETITGTMQWKSNLE